MNRYLVTLSLVGKMTTPVQANSKAEAKYKTMKRFSEGLLKDSLEDFVFVDEDTSEVELIAVAELPIRYEVRRVAPFEGCPDESMPIGEGLIAWEEAMHAEGCGPLGWGVYENKEDFTLQRVAHMDTLEYAQAFCALMNGRGE